LFALWQQNNERENYPYTNCRWLSLPGKKKQYQSKSNKVRWLSYAGMADKRQKSSGSVCPEFSPKSSPKQSKKGWLTLTGMSGSVCPEQVAHIGPEYPRNKPLPPSRGHLAFQSGYFLDSSHHDLLSNQGLLLKCREVHRSLFPFRNIGAVDLDAVSVEVLPSFLPPVQGLAKNLSRQLFWAVKRHCI